MSGLNSDGVVGGVSAGARFLSLLDVSDFGVLRERYVSALVYLVWVIVVWSGVHVRIGNTQVLSYICSDPVGGV